MSQFFETLMVICFGISWPTSILKSYTAKTAKGKSPLFLSFIMVGYLCGIISKIAAYKITYVFIFYVINLLMVSIDFGLYFRNKKLDARSKAV